MIDPELRVNVVDLGLIYKIQVTSDKKQETRNNEQKTENKEQKTENIHQPSTISHHPLVNILMTLTTPGCPLAAGFLPMARQALNDIPGFDPYNDLEIEITFDPPWHAGLMSERARAEIGY